MSILPLFSYLRRFYSEDPSIEGKDEIIAKIQKRIATVIQQSEPTSVEALQAHQISCHRIVHGLYLGSSRAFVESTHLSLKSNEMRPTLENHANQHKFNIVITVCPRMDLIAEYLDLSAQSSEDLEASFRNHHVQWCQVGRTVIDSPELWFSLVHDCTLIDSEEAKQEFPPEGMSMEDHQALSRCKAEKIRSIPSREWFQPTFAKIDQAIFGNQKVLVHCRAGVSRSATVIAAYFIARFDCTTEAALAFLQRQRPCVASKFKVELQAYKDSLK